MSELDGGSTGDARVDEVLRSLDTLSERPVDEHVAVFESAHTALREVLADRDDRPSPPVEP